MKSLFSIASQKAISGRISANFGPRRTAAALLAALGGICALGAICGLALGQQAEPFRIIQLDGTNVRTSAMATEVANQSLGHYGNYVFSEDGRVEAEESPGIGGSDLRARRCSASPNCRRPSRSPSQSLDCLAPLGAIAPSAQLVQSELRPSRQSPFFWTPLDALAQRRPQRVRFIGRPHFDSDGNVWVLFKLQRAPGVPAKLQYRRWNSALDVWEDMQIISERDQDFYFPAWTMDRDNNITAVFRNFNGGYALYAIRYESASGQWTSPELVLKTGFFQSTEAKADSEGNVAVVFQKDFPRWSVGSVVYDATTETWGKEELINNPSCADAVLPHLTRNRNGDALYLTYLCIDRRIAPRGANQASPETRPEGRYLYAHRFDSSLRRWGPAMEVPDTDQASTVKIPGTDAHFPAAVDSQGNLTLFWNKVINYGRYADYGVYASRFEDGQWLLPEELLPMQQYHADLANFGDADVSDRGDVIGVVTQLEDTGSHFYAFYYDAQDGSWKTESVYTSDSRLATRARISFNQPGRAVGTFIAGVPGQVRLTSMVFDGTEWLTELVEIPGSYVSFYQESVSQQEKTFLLFEGGRNLAQVDGIFGTWFRETPK